MDHHAIDQSRSKDCPPCQVLAGAHCLCFSFAATLSGGTRPAALRAHDFRNGLQGSDRRGIFEIHGKRVPNRFGDCISSVLCGFPPFSCFRTMGRTSKTGEKARGNSFTRMLPHNVGCFIIFKKLWEFDAPLCPHRAEVSLILNLFLDPDLHLHYSVSSHQPAPVSFNANTKHVVVTFIS